MRRRLKFHFVGTLLLMSHVANAFILLTASMDDVKRIANKFVSESLADKITKMLVKASEQMDTNLSEENEQNEDEFENISNELLTNFQPSKNMGRQRFQTKSKRVKEDEFVLATDTTVYDKSNTFAEWDGETMNQVAKEERMHNVDFDIQKPAYHEEDRLIDNEFDNDLKTREVRVNEDRQENELGQDNTDHELEKTREVRGNERVNEDKQDNELGQDNTDHELENLRFDHGHEINEYNHESEKPTNDFDLKPNEQSKEESKEATPPDLGSKKDIRQKKKIGPKRDIIPKRDKGSKTDIAPKRDIAPKKYINPKKDMEPQKSIEKQDESRSSEEQKIQDDSGAIFSEGKMILRQGPEQSTSEKSKYIEFMYTTKKNQASSNEPKEKNSMVNRPHHRLADSNEIKENVLTGNGVPFLKNIDERKYSEKSERRGNVHMQHLLATSGPIALPKVSNKHVGKEKRDVESESSI